MSEITFYTRTDKEHALQVLRNNGAENVAEYSLVENWGFTFEIAGEQYDARFWVNCYGVPFNEWEVWLVLEAGNHLLAKKIETELNILTE